MDPKQKDEARRATGKRCRAVRETLGWSVPELAAKAGVPRQYIYDLEGGIRVSVTNVVAVARATNVSTDYLLGVSERRESDHTHECCITRARTLVFRSTDGNAFYRRPSDGMLMPGEAMLRECGEHSLLREVLGEDIELIRCGEFRWKGKTWRAVGDNIEPDDE